MTGFTPATVALIWARDAGCCAVCGLPVSGERGVGWSVHHRRPRSMGGTSLKWVNGAANGLLACGSGTTGCHGWIEKHRKVARDRGLLVSALGNKVSADVKLIHAVHGRCELKDDGSVLLWDSRFPDDWR